MPSWVKLLAHFFLEEDLLCFFGGALFLDRADLLEGVLFIGSVCFLGVFSVGTAGFLNIHFFGDRHSFKFRSTENVSPNLKVIVLWSDIKL